MSLSYKKRKFLSNSFGIMSVISTFTPVLIFGFYPEDPSKFNAEINLGVFVVHLGLWIAILPLFFAIILFYFFLRFKLPKRK